MYQPLGEAEATLSSPTQPRRMEHARRKAGRQPDPSFRTEPDGELSRDVIGLGDKRGNARAGGTGNARTTGAAARLPRAQRPHHLGGELRSLLVDLAGRGTHTGRWRLVELIVRRPAVCQDQARIGRVRAK